MKRVEIYTKDYCSYCHAAKALLRRKGVAFEETDIGWSPDHRDEMIRRAGGRRTVPQIFIAGSHVGGSDELHALDHAGRLDQMLAA